MELITRTGDDYFRLLENLLPRGPAWSESDPLLAGIAPTLADVEARSHDLVRETDPRQTVELIERWEACCGLPDSCSIPGTETLAQRQQRLDAKINVAGGITESFYLSVLDSLGYPSATITKYEGMGFVCTSPCTASLYSDEWNFVWQVNFTEETKISDMTCLSQCTESLRAWGDTTAECVINKLCPSHTIVLFSYPPEATRASY